MQKSNVKLAVEEAKRFIGKAEELQRCQEYNSLLLDRNTVPQGALAASVRRASLDLSKSLAKLRGSDYR